MRLIGLAKRPGVLLGAAAVLLVMLRHPSPSGIAAGVLGAIAGMLAQLMLTKVGLLAGALLCGVRVVRVVLGFGRRIADWTTARRAVVLRSFPVLLSVAIAPARAPAKWRMFGAGVVAALAGAGLAVRGW